MSVFSVKKRVASIVKNAVRTVRPKMKPPRENDKYEERGRSLCLTYNMLPGKPYRLPCHAQGVRRGGWKGYSYVEQRRRACFQLRSGMVPCSSFIVKDQHMFLYVA